MHKNSGGSARCGLVETQAGRFCLSVPDGEKRDGGGMLKME